MLFRSFWGGDTMLQIKYPVCCGVDVHKQSIVATIALTGQYGNPQYLCRTFSTMNPDLRKFHDWLLQYNCLDVCMESTGKYWIPIFDYLEEDIRVCLTHPKYVRAIKGKKQTKRIPNGSLTCSGLIWFVHHSFHLKTSANSEN